MDVSTRLAEIDSIDPGVLRHNNRTLRLVNRKHRAHIRELTEATDEMVSGFFETETEAERAMRELWEKGKINCGPQDYDTIVEVCLLHLQDRSIPMSRIAH